MICYSLIASRGVIVAGFSPMSGPIAVNVINDAYPKPTPGILAHLEDDTYFVYVGDKKIAVTKALALSDGVEKVGPDQQSLRIHKASVVLGRAGDFVLVPAQGDDETLLFLIDVSRGVAGSVSLECSNKFSMFERGYQNPQIFQGEEEVILAALNRGETITASRTDKKFIWFGQRYTSEEIVYSLDPDLHCTVKSDLDSTRRVF